MRYLQLIAYAIALLLWLIACAIATVCGVAAVVVAVACMIVVGNLRALKNQFGTK